MPKVSIVIVTRNHREKAKNAVESALTQEGDNEIIVIDDASTDCTTEFLREHFPDLRIIRFDQQAGLVMQRQRSGTIAKGDFIVSIDDDAVFVDTKIVAEVAQMFDDPRIGAVSIPHLNCFANGFEGPTAPSAPDAKDTYIIKDFIGTAYAVRRDVYVQLNGFQGFLFHWGEETEYCQRLINAGYLVRRGARIGIRHYPEGVGKYTPRIQRYIYRNRLLIAWFNAPLIYFFPLFLLLWARAICDMVKKPGAINIALAGSFIGTVDMLRAWRLRKPIRMDRFKLWLWIRKNGLVPISQIAGRLPAQRADHLKYQHAEG